MNESFVVTRDTHVRLFLVEDHDLFREALIRYLASLPLFETVGVAVPDARLFDSVLAAQPDVVLLDLGLPSLDPTEVIKRLRALVPNVRVVILSLEYNDD